MRIQSSVFELSVNSDKLVGRVSSRFTSVSLLFLLTLLFFFFLFFFIRTLNPNHLSFLLLIVQRKKFLFFSCRTTGNSVAFQCITCCSYVSSDPKRFVDFNPQTVKKERGKNEEKEQDEEEREKEE